VQQYQLFQQQYQQQFQQQFQLHNVAMQSVSGATAAAIMHGPVQLLGQISFRAKLNKHRIAEV
jgi:hypothetical protein